MELFSPSRTQSASRLTARQRGTTHTTTSNVCSSTMGIDENTTLRLHYAVDSDDCLVLAELTARGAIVEVHVSCP